MATKEYKLKDLLVIKNGKDYKNLLDGSVPVYGTGGVMTYVNDKLYSGESILLPRKGSLENITYVNGDFWTVDTMYWSIVNETIAYPKYLYLYLSLLDLSKKDSGSTLPSMTFDSYYSVPVKLPSKEKQKEIANFIFQIIGKIEKNNKINAELESMAKTFYDYWFLQFEFPNENGKPYKSSGGKMVWSEELKREIPEGWTESTLSEISNMYQPNTFDAKLLEDDGKYRVYGAGGYMGQYHDFNHKESEIFISCRGSCGDIYRSMPFSLITGNAMIVHPNNIYLFEYLYLTLQRIGVKNCITGSVQPQITRTSLNDWKLVVPSEKVVRHFKSIVEPIFKKQETIIEENSKLNSLRDFLLPMLMNGQISFNK